ncbi:MAG TPA: DinB family protein [Ignavibacteriaceae bacterium]|nr:DinB family protein [Ignavibacteriaceae bacterium]
MYTTLQDFIDDWKRESSSTLKIFQSLSDESLNHKVYENGRSLGKLACHIVETISEMLTHAGLTIEIAGEVNRESAQSLAEQYKRASEIVGPTLLNNWSGAQLDDVIKMYGQDWKKRDVLISLVRHEIHHRAQMTVLMRQAGLKVPGIYGPSKEEWEAYGMTPQD